MTWQCILQETPPNKPGLVLSCQLTVHGRRRLAVLANRTRLLPIDDPAFALAN